MRAWRLLCCGIAAGALLSSCAAPLLNAPLGSSRRVSAAYNEYLQGLMKDATGETATALAHFEKVQRHDTASAAPYVRAGYDYLRLKKVREAVRAFDTAVRLRPDDDDARFVLALLYVQRQEYDSAVRHYDYLLARHQEDKPLQLKLRRILSQLNYLRGHMGEARAQIAAGLLIGPLDPDLLFFRAVMASEDGRYDEAIPDFRRVLEEDPDHADAMNGLAYAYAQKGTDLLEALELARGAVAQNPFSGAYLDTLGWICYRLGKVDEAIGFLERAAKLMIEPEILDHLAEAYRAAGRLQDAQDAWRRSLSLDPKQEDVRKTLKELKE
ncbi:MAG: tetratricopeptide repeat protein [Deltaproteobacteria bacterium]